MRTIKDILMNEGTSDLDADELIMYDKDQLSEYLDEGNSEAAHDICDEFFGLGPNYPVDIL